MTFERHPSRSARRASLSKLFVLALGLLSASGLTTITPPAHAQVCVLPGYPGAQPSPRVGHSMAYDSSGRVLLFGGRDAYGNVLGDTWRWDGTSWTLLPVTGPTARRESAMARVGGTGSWVGNLLLHGGIGSAGNVYDTWRWDGSSWSQLTGTAWNFAAGPGHFMGTAHGFYLLPIPHDVGVLVGPGLVELNEFGWLTPANGGATGAGHIDGAMTDFGTHDELLAFGGGSTNDTDVLHYEQCNLTDYCLVKDHFIDPAGPNARNNHALANDGTGALLFGGSSGDAQTWRYDGSWSIVASAGPGPRINHAMAYDRGRRKVVLFGGEWNGVTYGDTWEWDGPTNTWTQVRCSCMPPNWAQKSTNPALTARANYAMAYDSLRDRVLVFGGQTTPGGAKTNETWEWNGTFWSLRSSAGPSARDNAAMAYDSVRDRTVLFGGISSTSTILQDTWEWDGLSWTQQFPVTLPPARLGHVMAYYPPRSRVTLFGGSPGGVAAYLGDTWEWDGTNWAPVASNSGRAFGSISYDPGTQRLVVFGGQSVSGGAFNNGFQIWDGTSWTFPAVFPSAAQPSARVGAALAYDPARGHPVLYGGRNAPFTALSDTWELTGYGLFPWSQVTIPGPPARTGLSMAYHKGTLAMILFGGAATSAALNNETWALLADGPPAATGASGPQTVCEGSSVTFSATFSPASIGYEWRHDGVLIPTATGTSYTIPSVSNADAGNYTATAGNACGSASSAAMSLTVRSAPHITVQPQAQTVCAGGSVTFSAAATGEAPLSYQWRRNGTNVSTSPTLTINPVGGGDVGTYDVVITNACGNTTSSGALLVVGCPADEFRVNVGGPLTSPGDTGPSWSLDTSASPSSYVNAAAYGNNTGSTATAINMSNPSIPAGTPMSLFQTERFDFPGGAEMSWDFPTGPGTFRVRLYFAEIFTGITGPNQRLFDVKIEGQAALTNFDIYAQSGGLNRAIVKTFNATVTDGVLNITFLHGVENPTIFAIEIQRSGNIRVNAGGATVAAGDTGPAWSNDTFAAPSPYANAAVTNATGSTGTAINMTDPSIPAGTPMSLFQSERHDFSGGAEMSYNFPTGAGTHLVRLYFSEIFGGITGPGQRVFDVQAEGITVLKDFDIYKAAGSNKAVARSFAVAVADSFLTLTFVHKIENPTVMAIEIVPQAGFRVNVGGPSRLSLDSGPNWSVDSGASPSPYVNAAATGNATGATATTIDLTDPSVPPGSPMNLFQDERFDPPGGADMSWAFPTGPGSFQVRLYFAEIFTGITAPGQRVFNVSIEGQAALTNFDIFAQVGLHKALVKTFNVAVADDALNIDFAHVTENPVVMAIQVVPNVVSGVPTTPPPPVSLLGQNAPNPFNGATAIAFQMKQPDRAVVQVYDVAGRLVVTLLDARLPAGAHRVDWDGRDGGGQRMPAGIYMYRLRLGDGFAQSRRMMLLR